ncbi:root hair defective 3 GTP-binding protein-domain-containing protein [Mycena galopus ATCC 62051]|nr:root hair defective 3 GTP-binding protein-domain-containing protein [Mycena galopus ATCC 62051]
MSHFKAGEYRILYSDSFVSVEAGNEEHLTVQVDAPDPDISSKIGNEWIIEPGAEDGQYYIKNKMHNSYAVWKSPEDSDEVTSALSTVLDDAKSLWKIVLENDGLYRIFPATNGADRLCWSVEDSMLGTLIVLSMPLKEGTALWQFKQVGGQQSDGTCCECCCCRYGQVRNDKDLNLPTQQELIAQYRCDEISSIALAEFNERAKSPVEADRRQMMMRNWRTEALARYDRDASRYHQGVYQRKRTDLIAALDATLSLGQLKKLREAYLVALYGVLVVQVWNGAMAVLFNPLYFAFLLFVLATAWAVVQLPLVGPLFQIARTIGNKVQRQAVALLREHFATPVFTELVFAQKIKQEDDDSLERLQPQPM